MDLTQSLTGQQATHLPTCLVRVKQTDRHTHGQYENITFRHMRAVKIQNGIFDIIK